MLHQVASQKFHIAMASLMELVPREVSSVDSCRQKNAKMARTGPNEAMLNGAPKIQPKTYLSHSFQHRRKAFFYSIPWAEFQSRLLAHVNSGQRDSGISFTPRRNKAWLQNLPNTMDLHLTAEIMPHSSHSLLHWVSSVNSTFRLWILLGKWSSCWYFPTSKSSHKFSWAIFEKGWPTGKILRLSKKKSEDRGHRTKNIVKQKQIDFFETFSLVNPEKKT